MTHLQIRGNQLLPIDGLRVYLLADTVYFELEDGNVIKEQYILGEAEALTAYLAYREILLNGQTPSSILLTDTGSGGAVAFAVVNGVPTRYGSTVTYGAAPPSSISIVDQGNGLVSTVYVENGVVKVSQ